jgi:hypothetical protein
MTTPPAEAKVMQSDRDLDKLPLGIYRVYWQSGGSSLASVGMDYAGKRWIAPTNWTAREVKGPAALISSHGWAAIERVERIDIPDPDEEDEGESRASTPSASAGEMVKAIAKAVSSMAIWPGSAEVEIGDSGEYRDQTLAEWLSQTHIADNAADLINRAAKVAAEAAILALTEARAGEKG